MIRIRKWRLIAAIICIAGGLIGSAGADVGIHNVFGDHMVLQRDTKINVWGWADGGEKVTVQFGGQSVSATAGEDGKWAVQLAPMKADTKPQDMVVSGKNTVTLGDVLVGDVWLCSGQSNMDMSLGGCDRKEDIAGADFPGIRSFRTPGAGAEIPLKELKGNPKWVVCGPETAGGFSGAAFYFARKIYQETNRAVPIGLIVSSVGGTSIDLWLTPEGVVDVPALHPLLSQTVLPGGPFSLCNGMIAPLAPYGIKGAIWYQGENAERSVQSDDSYFLKMKALVEGWKRLWGMSDFPFYYVMIANWGEFPKDAAPVFRAGGWDADTRLQQANAMALPHAGCASALDIGDSSMGDRTWDGWHPKDKLDVGERLALWALKNDYGRPDIVASGPMLKEVSVSGNEVVCTFDHLGSGLMVGSRKWYEPTKELADGTLKHFVIAGSDGKWYPAAAKIKDNKVIMSSPSVPEPRKVSYACWPNPEGCNLYNKEGLPAAPFHVEDVAKGYSIVAKAGEGGEISPAGTNRLLQRTTALYTIKPKPGCYIQDVKVDGVSVGSVPYYTFDPVYADHTIEASFAKEAPIYTITTSAGNGGSIIPLGAVSAVQGESKTCTIAPQPGMFTKSLTIDGVAISPRDGFSFSDIRKNHTITASFACRVVSEAGYGGSISPCGDVPAEYGGSLTFKIAPILGYSIARVIVDGKEAGTESSYTFENVASSHSLLVEFKGGSVAAGEIPKTDQLIFAALSESLPAIGATGAWPLLFPEGVKLSPISTPAVVKIAGRNYSRNLYLDGDGYAFKTYSEPITCSGASIVVAARPIRIPGGSGWFSIVDVFYDRLVLGIRNDSGKICVRRNGPIDDSETAIPDGRITILSLIVEPDGQYKVYADGAEVMAGPAAGEMTSLVPGVAGGFAKSITVGRNAPDAWTTFNGDIGDVFLYKVALTNEERKGLEAYIEHRLSDR